MIQTVHHSQVRQYPISFPGRFYSKRSKPGRPPKHILKLSADIEKESTQSKEKEGTEEGNGTASI